jgi:hypothetical protein
MGARCALIQTTDLGPRISDRGPGGHLHVPVERSIRPWHQISPLLVTSAIRNFGDEVEENVHTLIPIDWEAAPVFAASPDSALALRILDDRSSIEGPFADS